MQKRFLVLLATSLALALGLAAVAQDVPGPSARQVEYSPYPEADFPNQVFFGDTHLHTSYSADAGMVGSTLGPQDAYRFARGETVTSSAVSDERAIGEDGRCGESVGNTVDVEAATYTDAIGAPFLQAFWKDPDFDPALRVFYYVRVLEIPTPRWTTYDARIFGVKRPEDVPASIQDRAYTSPIGYHP